MTNRSPSGLRPPSKLYLDFGCSAEHHYRASLPLLIMMSALEAANIVAGSGRRRTMTDVSAARLLNIWTVLLTIFLFASLSNRVVKAGRLWHHALALLPVLLSFIYFYIISQYSGGCRNTVTLPTLFPQNGGPRWVYSCS